jgi:hypothetical protein
MFNKYDVYILYNILFYTVIKLVGIKEIKIYIPHILIENFRILLYITSQFIYDYDIFFKKEYVSRS